MSPPTTQPTVEDDDPSRASDAVSLHTIAEQDAYAAQEQEDADFALALALEEQESANFARTQRIIRSQPEAFPPYRDEPEAGDEDIDPPPYRDDPDAEPAEGEAATDAEAAAAHPPRRQNIFLRILRKIIKAWLCYLIGSTVFTIIVVVAVLVWSFVYGRKPGDPKEAAWSASGSQDYKINLPKLYPALDKTTSSQCKKTWEDVASGLPCHRMILSPAWDDGNATEAKAAGADPVYYKQAVCTQTCKKALDRLDASMPSACADRTNRFDFGRYGNDGKAYFGGAYSIEEGGPADVPKSLLARYERLCNGPPKRYIGKQPLSCAEELWLAWGIVDGKNEANLNGLDTFLEQTSVKKTIPASQQTTVKLMPSGQNATFTRSVGSRRVGPGRGETECSDCLKDWLARKTLSFRHGEVLEPGTRTPVLLGAFADKLKEASQRCYAYYQDDHELIWKGMGWWCDGKPCRKDDDYSIPEIVVRVLHGYQAFTPSLDKIPKNQRQAVGNLLTAMTDMRCGAMGLMPGDFTNPIVTSAHLVSRLCTPRCLNAVDRVSSLVEAAQYPGVTLTAITDSIAAIHTLCKSSPPVSFTATPDTLCAPGYAALNLTSLITSPPPSSSPASSPPLPRASILSTFRTALASVKTWNANNRYGHDSLWRRNDALLKLRIAESACNICAGEMFIGKDNQWKETVDAFLADPAVNSTEYVIVAREGWVQCGRMHGLMLWESQIRKLLEKVGLGDGVGGVPIGY